MCACVCVHVHLCIWVHNIMCKCAYVCVNVHSECDTCNGTSAAVLHT